MGVRVYFGPIGKSARRVVVAPQARISFRDIPKDRGVARIEFLRFFEIRQRIFPTALAPIDRGGGIPHFSIVRRGFVGDSEFGAGQLVVAVAVVIIVSEREANVARVRLEAQRGVRRDLGLRQAAPGSIVTEPVKLGVKSRRETMRQRKVRIARDGFIEQTESAFAVLARITGTAPAK